MRNNIQLAEMNFSTKTHYIDVVYSDNIGLGQVTEFNGVTIQEIVDETTFVLNMLNAVVRDGFTVTEITAWNSDVVEIVISGTLDNNSRAYAKILTQPALQGRIIALNSQLAHNV